MLILAVVAIRAVTGDRILEYATNARDDYQDAAREENTTLQSYLDKIEANVPGDNGDVDAEKTYAVLMDGPSFNATIPKSATSIVFNNEVAPAEASLTDVSEAGDGSIVAWLDGTTYNVSTQDSDVIYANPDSSMMFNNYDDYGDNLGFKIKNIDFSNFDTSKVENMSNMFCGCNGLSSLDVSKFNTSNLESMRSMFSSCNLTSLDLSSFNTENVTDMNGMFANCRNLNTLTLSENFDTSNVTNMQKMFSYCSKLTLDCSGWNVDKVTSYSDFNKDAPGVTAPTWAK